MPPRAQPPPRLAARLVAVGAIAVVTTATASAEVRRGCDVSHNLESDPQRWSYPQRTAVVFLSPAELSARQRTLGVNNRAGHYALIWFPDDQAAILEFNGPAAVWSRVYDDAQFSHDFAADRPGAREYTQANPSDRSRPRRWRIDGRSCRTEMTYAQFEAWLVWFWVAWLGALAGFMVWAAWVWLIDEPRKRRRIQARLSQVIKPRQAAPSDRTSA
jgi:hypothetical protein